MDKNTLIATTVLALVGMLVILGGIALLTEDKQEETISSAGTAIITTTPDEASVIISIQTEAKTAQEAKDDNSAKSDAVFAALEALEVKTETQYFNIYPQYEWEDGKQKDKGFQATTSIKVTTKNFEEIGNMVDAAISAGATGIDSISFELSEEKRDSLKEEALAQAAQDARVKAQAVVAGLNTQLGDIVSVSFDSYDYTPYPFFAKAEGMDVREAVATTIEPQELDVRATVQVIFELE